MSKEPRPLVEMQQRAADIVATLGPYCRRISIAGSVRRQKAQCSDLELVAIPKMVPAGLFGDREQSALYHFLKGHLVVFLKGDNPEGRYHQLQMPDGLQVDLFLAQEDNWGLQFLIRTGSADFSQSILAQWKRLQSIPPDRRGCVDAHLVYRDGTPLATPEEHTVFDLVHLPWIDPAQRTEPVR